jgi:predicted transcriptional regulator
MNKRSLIERYVSILEALSQSGDMRAYHIACYARLKWVELANHLDRLYALGLIERRTLNGVTLYRITTEGRRILERYNSLVRVFVQPDQESRVTI